MQVAKEHETYQIPPQSKLITIYFPSGDSVILLFEVKVIEISGILFEIH